MPRRVCREYLSNGHRSGNYWMVGDVRNTHGRSMHVRLKAVGGKAAGKWVDESSGEYGDLLDVIEQSCGLVDFREVADEARRFLSMPLPDLQSRPSVAEAHNLPRHAARLRPRVACSPYRSRSPARWPNDILLDAAFCCPRMSARCVSIPAATTGISCPARRRPCLR